MKGIEENEDREGCQGAIGGQDAPSKSGATRPGTDQLRHSHFLVSSPSPMTLLNLRHFIHVGDTN